MKIVENDNEVGFEDQNTLFRSEALSKQTIAALRQQRSSKKSRCNCWPYLLALFIGAAIFGTVYYIQTQDDTYTEKIKTIEQKQKPVNQPLTVKDKPEATSKPNVAEPKDDIDMNLFQDKDDAKVSKVSKVRKGEAPQIRGNGIQPHVSQNNPMMKSYLEATAKAEQDVMGILESMKSRSQKDFVFPKILWIYVQDEDDETLYVKKCLEQAKRIAKKEGFDVKLVSEKSLPDLIPKDRADTASQTLKALRKEATNNPVSGYDMAVPIAERDIVLFQILHENGGIVMDKGIVLLQDFSWITNIARNQYANCGNPDFSTNYVGFHNINFTTAEQKYTLPDGSQRYISNSVGLQSFFMAGVAKGQFLGQLLKMLYILYSNPQSAKETLQALKIGKAITNLFVVINAFPIASRIVLKEKQSLSQKGLLSIDYFGIKTINSNYFPKKLGHFFEYTFQQKIFRNLATYTLFELQKVVGPLRLMAIVPFESFMDSSLDKIFKAVMSAEHHQYSLLHPDSFFVKYLFPDAEKTYLLAEIQTNNIDESATSWQALPKIIWLETPPGKKRNVIEWLCYQNILKYAKKSGFIVREVDPLSLEEWLNDQEAAWVRNTADKAKTKVFNKMKIELAKLHILIRYGGIWLNRHYFAMQTFDWLVNIARHPTQQIFNRYGPLPKIFMYFYHHYGQPFQWTYDQTVNTKSMWHVGLDANFIAAQPDAQLLKDWVRTFTKFLTRPYKDNLDEMGRLQVATQRWTVRQNAYFASLDSVKMVMGNKQRELTNLANNEETKYTGPKSAPEFYNIWCMSGAQGPFKLDLTFSSQVTDKSQLNPKSNTLIWRYPKEYAQGILGKVNKLGRLYHVNSAQLNRIINQADLEKLTKGQLNIDSYFYQDLYSDFKSNITRIQGKLVYQ